jgi:hypothetical protein
MRKSSVPAAEIATVSAAGKNIPVFVSVPCTAGVPAEPSTPAIPVEPEMVMGII